MSIKLHKQGYDYAVAIIQKGLEVEHDMGNWTAVKPTVDEEARYLDTHTLSEYGKWFLGFDTDANAEGKKKFAYPFGDFAVVHKSGLMVAEGTARKNGHAEIAGAAKKLIDMLGHSKK